MIMKSLREAYGQHITEIGRHRDDIVILEGDLADSTQSEPFQQAFPERHFQIGIAEQNMVGMAAGLAQEGKIPIVNSFAAFIAMRACKQVRTDVAYPNLNVKFVVSHSGLSAGTAGPTHHTVEDIGIMRSIPNMTVLVPGDANEVEQVIDRALEINGPVYVRLSAGEAPDITVTAPDFTVGVGTIVCTGQDLTIFTTGTLLSEGLAVREKLISAHGLHAQLVQMASVKPLDCGCVRAALALNAPIFTIEEHNIYGGLGSAVAEVIAEAGVAVSFRRFGIADRFAPITGNPPFLFENEGLSVDALVAQILSVLNR